ARCLARRAAGRAGRPAHGARRSRAARDAGAAAAGRARAGAAPRRRAPAPALRRDARRRERGAGEGGHRGLGPRARACHAAVRLRGAGGRAARPRRGGAGVIGGLRVLRAETYRALHSRVLLLGGLFLALVSVLRVVAAWLADRAAYATAVQRALSQG